MKIACVGYRQWALNIYKKIMSNFEAQYLLVTSKEEYSEEALFSFKPDIVLFYGWSWKISNSVLEEFECIMLHPSKLPKYRGGSPIQNQIINGETESAVTLFVMTDEMDAGDIVAQKSYSLQGHLCEILNRIEKNGIELTMTILSEGIFPITQDHSAATFCKRRKPEQSEITIEEIINKSGIYLYNKIRMLEDPYPNAYIKTSDNKKLMLKLVELC